MKTARPTLKPTGEFESTLDELLETRARVEATLDRLDQMLAPMDGMSAELTRGFEEMERRVVSALVELGQAVGDLKAELRTDLDPEGTRGALKAPYSSPSSSRLSSLR